MPANISSKDALQHLVDETRRAIEAILFGQDSRLLVIVGPCSIHDPKAILEGGIETTIVLG